MTRLLRVVPLVFWLSFAPQAPLAQASNEWCDSDPVLTIITPGGRLVPVYVDVGSQSVLYTPSTLLSSAVPSYTAAPARGGAATEVTVTVTVPSLALGSTFATRLIVSTGPFGSGIVYSQVMGVSDRPMTSTFILPYS